MLDDSGVVETTSAKPTLVARKYSTEVRDFRTYFIWILSSQVIDTITSLVQLLGGDRVLTRGEWKALKDDTKRKKVKTIGEKETWKNHRCISLNAYWTRSVVQLHQMGKKNFSNLPLRFVAPHSCFICSFQSRYQDDHILADRIFDSIDERFASSSTTQEKVELLALVSDLGLTMKEVCFTQNDIHKLDHI